MPDNISLTSQDIYSLQQDINRAVSRLNTNSVFFKKATETNVQKLNLIGDNTQGFKIYAAQYTVSMANGKNTATLDINSWPVSFSSNPVISVSVQPESNVAALWTHSIISSDTSGCRIKIKCSENMTTDMDLIIHVTAIGIG